MTEEQSDIEMAIASSLNAYFAHRAYMQPTPAFLQLFSDAFQLGADYAMDAAPKPADSPDGWVSVDERLPETYTHVLVAFSEGTVTLVASYGDSFSPDGWFLDGEYKPGEITHWRYLPATPNASKDQS